MSRNRLFPARQAECTFGVVSLDVDEQFSQFSVNGVPL
jgi:hypothetical protein